jgi:hypothetical protein
LLSQLTPSPSSDGLFLEYLIISGFAAGFVGGLKRAEKEIFGRIWLETVPEICVLRLEIYVGLSSFLG